MRQGGREDESLDERVMLSVGVEGGSEEEWGHRSKVRYCTLVGDNEIPNHNTATDLGGQRVEESVDGRCSSHRIYMA